MFSSSYFAPDYFNEYFKVRGTVLPSTDGGGNSTVCVRKDDLSQFNLNRDDEEILEFVVAFVLSRSR